MLIAATALASCSDELGADVSAPQQTERKLVSLSFEATLGREDASATRVGYEYGGIGDGSKNGLKLTWSEKDQIGVYIKTTEGIIVRAGSISKSGDTTDDGKTCVFSGLVSEKFEDEKYIYMHPDLGRRTFVNLEDMSGQLGNTAHINDHLPIVWREGNAKGEFLGYVLHLTLNFQTINPGKLKKVTLLTDRRNMDDQVYGDRIFPRHYSINYLALDAGEFPFNPNPSGSIVEGSATNNSDYTHAITLNVTGDGTVHETGGLYTTDVYLTSSEVKNLNIFSSKIKVMAVGEGNNIYSSKSSVSFKGQSTMGTGPYYSDAILKNGTVRKMTADMQEGALSTTIINETYKVNSILGMWNEYGRPYDPNGLMVYEGGDATLPATGSGVMPDQLINNITALRTRSLQSLTGTATSNTPTHTWVLYESQCAGFTNSYMIVNDGGANTDHGNDHTQSNTTINNIEITSPTKVYFTFLGEFAWWQNLIGYYHYNKNNIPASSNDITKIIIFPNASKPGHEPFNTYGAARDNIGKAEDAPLKLGETVKLLYMNPDNGTVSEEFPKDEVIGFFLMQNPQANGFQQSAFSLMNWNVPRYFSNQAWNADNAGWPTTTGRLNTFVSADVCNAAPTSKDYKAPPSAKIPGIAFYGAMDDINKRGEVTAWSAMLFAISTSDPAAMKTQNRMYFNIGTGNTVVLKENVND